MNSKAIIVEAIFNSSAEKIWKAISDKNEMKKWYFDLAEFKAELGFKFEFTGGPAPERQYIHRCQITEVVAEKKLAYSWCYDGYDGYSLVSFELFAQGNATRIKLSHSGIETFSAANPDFAKINFEKGWAQIINISLKEYLENCEMKKNT